MSYTELYADSARGIYIPQHFAETYNPDRWVFKHCESDSLNILRQGPEHESYWDAWQDVLDYAETTNGWQLYQDGDLWAINYQGAIDDLNDYCQEQLEYEESHIDAGEGYSHLVSESWTDTDTKELMRNLTGSEIMEYENPNDTWPKWVPKWSIDPMGLEPEEIVEIALDIFTMVPGHIFGPDVEGIVLAIYLIQELEIQIPGQFHDVLPHIKDSCEAYIKGDFAYMATDSVWYAIVDTHKLQNAIKGKVLDNAN